MTVNLVVASVWAFGFLAGATRLVHRATSLAYQGAHRKEGDPLPYRKKEGDPLPVHRPAGGL